MEYRLLGASGLEVSVLSFGTMTLGGEGRFAAIGNVQVEEARRHIEICMEAGVNLFDTADIYSFGKSEEVLGQALGAHRKDIVLATKVFVRLEPGTNKSGLTRRHILEACEASLRRLGTDYIDLYQSHNFDSLTPLDETLRAFDVLVRGHVVQVRSCGEVPSPRRQHDCAAQPVRLQLMHGVGERGKERRVEVVRRRAADLDVR